MFNSIFQQLHKKRIDKMLYEKIINFKLLFDFKKFSIEESMKKNYSFGNKTNLINQ